MEVEAEVEVETATVLCGVTFVCLGAALTSWSARRTVFSCACLAVIRKG